MKIAIDARGLDGNKSGIPTYIEEIVKQINQNDHENEYILYSTKEIKLDFEPNKNIKLKCTEKNHLGSLWIYFKLPQMLKQDEIDVYWGTQHVLPARNKYTKNIKYVVTIHDLAIEKIKGVGSFKNTIIQKVFLKKSLKNADKIIAISEATKKDIIEIFKTKEEKIKVIYNGTNLKDKQNKNKIDPKEEKQIQEKFGIKDTPYIFFLSTIEPRKNIETLIRSFNYIRRKENTNLKLIIAGGLGWKYESVLEQIEKSEYKEDIILPGYISKNEKNYLYKNAECFVYPSLYEGFGLPILEAMAEECLVITGNNSSLPEVGGDVAIYYNNALDYGELGNKIIETINLSQEEKDKKIKQGIEQVKKFSWEKCAKETLDIIGG